MGILLKFLGGMGLSGLVIGTVDNVTSNNSLGNAIVLLLQEWGVVSNNFSNYIIASGNADNLMWILSIGLVLLSVYKELPNITNNFFKLISVVFTLIIKFFEKYTLYGRARSNTLKEQILESKIKQFELEEKLKAIKNKGKEDAPTK